MHTVGWWGKRNGAQTTRHATCAGKHLVLVTVDVA